MRNAWAPRQTLTVLVTLDSMISFNSVQRSISMQTARRMVVALAVLTASIGGESPVHAQLSGDETDREVLESLAFGFLANRQQFSDFACEFTITQGKVASVEDARALRIDEQYTLEGIWAVSGDTVRYELLCPSMDLEIPRRIESANSGQWLSSECGSSRVLFNGQIRLVDDPVMRTANIEPVQGETGRVTKTPFTLGGMGADEEFSPGNGILRALSGEWIVQYQGKKEDSGVSVDVIELGGTPLEPEMVVYRWLLDSERGFLPIEMHYLEGTNEPSAMTIATEVREAENGGFYIHSGLTISHLDRPPPYRIEVYRIRSLRIGKPSDEELSLRLATGTNVVDVRDMRRSVMRQEARLIQVNDLESLLNECAVSPAQGGVISGSAVWYSSPWRVGFVGINALVLLVAGRFILGRARH